MQPSFHNIHFIINPISGTQDKERLPEWVAKYFSAYPNMPDLHYTKRAGHGQTLVAEALAKGADCIVAVGGDGTINEVGSALVHTGATLGIIPCGSGNGLARHLGIPLNMGDAVRNIATGKAMAIDVASVNNRFFFCTSGMGFDAVVSHRFAQLPKRGLLNYAKAAWSEFFDYQAGTYQINIDGRTANYQAFMVTLANAGQFGNNAYISPHASINDGLLDLCIVKPFPKWKGLPMIGQSFLKTIHRSAYVEVIQGKHIEVIPPSGLLHLDGDPLELPAPFSYRIAPKALQVCVPA